MLPKGSVRVDHIVVDDVHRGGHPIVAELEQKTV